MRLAQLEWRIGLIRIKSVKPKERASKSNLETPIYHGINGPALFVEYKVSLGKNIYKSKGEEMGNYQKRHHRGNGKILK